MRLVGDDMSIDDGTVNTGGNGRSTGGRFSSGNSFGRGSPVTKRMHDFRLALLEAGDPETLKSLFKKMGELGLAGDTTAARLYIEYCVGKPVQALELSGPDGVTLGGDMVRIRTAILAALVDDPPARFKVARALLSLSTGGDGDGPSADDGV